MFLDFFWLIRFLIKSRVPRRWAVARDMALLLFRLRLGLQVPSPLCFAGLTLHYGDATLLQGLLREVFIARHYAVPLAAPVNRIIDAGANIGVSALFFLLEYPTCHVVCFEPVPASFELLQRNLEENGFADRVELHRAALGTQAGATLRLAIRKDIPGGDIGATAIRSCRLLYHSADDLTEKEVPVLQLSTFLQQPVDLLKLDIEGGETAVWPEIVPHFGGIRSLAMEYHHFPSGNPLTPYISTLEEQGFDYVISSLNAETLVSATPGNFQLNIRALRIPRGVAADGSPCV